MLTGAVFPTWADIAAHALTRPEDIPIGVITGLAAGAACDRDPWALRLVRRGTGAGMTAWRPGLRLVLLGAGPRLAGAAVIVALLWLGFFWATSSMGAP